MYTFSLISLGWVVHFVKFWVHFNTLWSEGYKCWTVYIFIDTISYKYYSTRSCKLFSKDTPSGTTHVQHFITQNKRLKKMHSHSCMFCDLSRKIILRFYRSTHPYGLVVAFWFYSFRISVLFCIYVWQPVLSTATMYPTVDSNMAYASL